jgi:putative transposase
VKERRRLVRHPARAIPELVAPSRWQLHWWDITKFAGPVQGTYFACYVMFDVNSR